MKTLTLWKVQAGSRMFVHVALGTQDHDKLTPETMHALHETVRIRYGMDQLAPFDSIERVGYVEAAVEA